jgi:hypothetical protein
MIQWPWFKYEGQLSGNSIEKMQLWNDRFCNADFPICGSEKEQEQIYNDHFNKVNTNSPQVIKYDAWTYSDLKKLSNLIKSVAYKRYKLTNIKVGSLVLGWDNIYAGDRSVFAKIHPNIFLKGSRFWYNFPNLIALLSADNNKYGAFPGGIAEGTPFTEFFGKQWGSLSKATDLDVIILRDSYLGVGIYERIGPFGKTASSDPEKVREWSSATADLVRQTKIANPKALVIGYSNAASAVADWRVNCFDLEAIAKEGYLDGWIDQTWGAHGTKLGNVLYIFGTCHWGDGRTS